MIKVNNISFSVNNKKLFHNLSFAVSEGELVRISGPNGSGKTTLLKIMLGITPPNKGFIEKELSTLGVRIVQLPNIKDLNS